MGSRGDERAVTVQVGAVILLAFVVIAIATYQAQVVPQQNSQVEYNHNQQVHQRMQELRDVIQTVPATGGGGSVAVPLGTTYPARSIFVNPAPPGGTLSTVGTTNETIAFAVGNASATDTEAADYWNGTTQSFTTGALVYQPRYNAYQNAPLTIYENSVVYNRFDTANVTLAGQNIFDGKRITLVAMNGSLRESSGTASVTLRPVSASTQSLSVTNRSGPVTVTIPSTLTASEWRTLLQESGQYDAGGDPDAYVTAVSLNRTVPSPEFGQPVYFVDFVLEPDVTYTLRLAKVGVGTGVSSRENGAYLAPVGSTTRQTPTGGSETLTVQVRDRYNNPESGVTVNATVVSGGGSVSPAQTESDDAGTATVTYDAPSSAGTATVRMNVSTSPRSWELVNFTVQVQATGGGGGGGGNGAYEVEWQDPSAQTGVSCPSGPNGTCSVDGAQTTSVSLTMGTSPTADGASVSYAVNNTTVGTISPQSGTTDNTGEDTTTLSLSENRTVVVYATSGAGGDSITLDVSDLPGGGGGPGDTTPPTLDSASVSANQANGNSRTDTVTFDYQTSDNIGVQNVTLTGVKTSDSTVLFDDTTTVTDATGRSYSFSRIDTRNTDIDITIVVNDTSGNSQTCTGTLTSDGQTITKSSDMTCSTSPNVQALPSVARATTGTDGPHSFVPGQRTRVVRD
ncbi:hypothetical protein [Haloarchaeobius sp. DT45]|uniref:hypothetical protein n=1 Tax=Haloarchaeobius sp. DT45 TaxID=3446116 RepID=UPI003F6B4607